MELIDKAEVVEEIEKLKRQLLRGACSSQISMETNCKAEAYDEVLSFLNTLEVKETDDAYKQGYNDAIDKACDAYCRLCDTKECGDTGECEWVEKFRKRLMR